MTTNLHDKIAKAILDLALDLEKTGRLVAITEGQERTDFVARNRNIQCALEDALRNATTPQAQPALEPLTEWQPIETAPKNGFRILLYSPPVKDFSGDFHNIVIGWYVIGRIPADNHWATGLRNGGKFIGQYVHNPTHWMPLPDPPKDTHGITKGNT